MNIFMYSCQPLAFCQSYLFEYVVVVALLCISLMTDEFETFFFFSHADFLLGNSICKESITLLAYFHIRFVFFTDLQNIYYIYFACVYDFRKQGLKFKISVPFSS